MKMANPFREARTGGAKRRRCKKNCSGVTPLSEAHAAHAPNTDQLMADNISMVPTARDKSQSHPKEPHRRGERLAGAPPKAIPLSPELAFNELRAYCLAKEGAVEDYPWGDVVWKVKGKLFAAGGDKSARFTVKNTPDKQSVLTMHPQISVAAYVGRYGWVTIEVNERETLELAKDLIDESYELVTRRASKR